MSSLPQETPETTITTSPASEPSKELDKSELQRYREGVQGLYDLQSDKVITNGKAEHAAILFEIFFKHAEKRVRIFCRNLNSAVFGNERLLTEFKHAVQKKKLFVDICYQDEHPDESEFLTFAKSCPNVNLRRAPVPARHFDTNFATMDDTAIRVEPNRKQVEARAIMYAPEITSEWNAMFDKLTVA